MKVDRGTVILVTLGTTVGREQRGTRPCVLVSDPEVTVDQRFPMVCVVPLTGTAGEGTPYPPLTAGSRGLRKRSFALVDQLRSVDKRRVRTVFGQILPNELNALEEGIRLYVGLGDE